MKRISNSLYFGFVGSKSPGKESGKEILLSYLKKEAIESNFSNEGGNDKDYL